MLRVRRIRLNNRVPAACSEYGASVKTIGCRQKGICDVVSRWTSASPTSQVAGLRPVFLPFLGAFTGGGRTVCSRCAKTRIRLVSGSGCAQWWKRLLTVTENLPQRPGLPGAPLAARALKVKPRLRYTTYKLNQGHGVA